MEYLIQKSDQRPKLQGLWDEDPWSRAPALKVDQFLPQSSAHHPRVEARVLYREDGLYVFFRVFDKYVLCQRTEYQQSVCRDSCVEFFVQPKANLGYFNFEINCGGTMLLSYVTDPHRQEGQSVARYVNVPAAIGGQVRIFHSLPKIVYPEITQELEWKVEYFIPFRLFEIYVGALGPIAGQTWRANFYKCADESSHPHWASWAPLAGQLNFHLPQYFAPIRFE